MKSTGVCEVRATAAPWQHAYGFDPADGELDDMVCLGFYPGPDDPVEADPQPPASAFQGDYCIECTRSVPARKVGVRLLDEVYMPGDVLCRRHARAWRRRGWL